MKMETMIVLAARTCDKDRVKFIIPALNTFNPERISLFRST